MGSLNANITNQKGRKNVGVEAVAQVSAIDLVAALDAVNVVGQQMFERDCLGYTFDLWARPAAAQDLDRQARVTAGDVLADIADIRALPSRHPEVREVDADLLAAVDAIEAYVLIHRPTMQ